MKKRYYIVIAALLFGASVAKAQDHIKLTRVPIVIVPIMAMDSGF